MSNGMEILRPKRHLERCPAVRVNTIVLLEYGTTHSETFNRYLLGTYYKPYIVPGTLAPTENHTRCMLLKDLEHGGTRR